MLLWCNYLMQVSFVVTPSPLHTQKIEFVSVAYYCLEDSKIRLSLPKPFRILLKIVKCCWKYSTPAPIICYICLLDQWPNGTSKFNPPPTGWAKLVASPLIMRRAGLPAENIANKKKRSGKTVIQEFKCTNINFMGEKCAKP